ncbi:MAG: nicotinate-nucleotide adenylyltransferase [Deltaproteobacteria bacterium]|nr:nicotinate-nucleotide adenylyltransferase [Deltaproteobacteria bacterium]
MKVGILGGTFDPIHLGHLRTAEEIGERMALEKVCIIPSASPPHKTGEPVVPFHHRLAAARLAVGDSPLLEVLDIEGRRRGPSYSIDTLKACRRIFGPQAELFFILGTDAFLEIDSWKAFKELFTYTHFVINQRPGTPLKELKSILSKFEVPIQRESASGEFVLDSGKSVIQIQTTMMDISSTRIRNMVKKGRSIRFLVPEAVRRYILENDLYGK